MNAKQKRRIYIVLYVLAGVSLLLAVALSLNLFRMWQWRP